jgi:hypothetical protein
MPKIFHDESWQDGGRNLREINLASLSTRGLVNKSKVKNQKMREARRGAGAFVRLALFGTFCGVLATLA